MACHLAGANNYVLRNDLSMLIHFQGKLNSHLPGLPPRLTHLIFCLGDISASCLIFQTKVNSYLPGRHYTKFDELPHRLTQTHTCLEGTVFLLT